MSSRTQQGTGSHQEVAMNPVSAPDRPRIAFETEERKLDRVQVAATASPIFSLDMRREGDSAVIMLSGELDLATAPELDRAICEAEDSEIGRIVIDMSDLSFMDSTGLQLLVRAKSRDLEADDRLRFIPSKHDAVNRLLSITGTREILS
jgi:anti-sigma B factor antagonist